jgi:hypothetical protein
VYWTGRWADLAACLDRVVKRKVSCCYQDSNSDSPVVSQAKSLHHLCCPRYCYEIWRNIPSVITASFTVGYCSFLLNGEGIFVPSNLKFVTFLWCSHIYVLVDICDKYSKEGVMGIRYLPVCLAWCYTAYSICETVERIQMKSLGCWLQEAILIPSVGIFFPSRVTNIYGTLSVCLCVFLYNRLYFRWWKDSEDHPWQCLLCITYTVSTRLFLVWWSWKWSVLLYITPKSEKPAFIFEFWKPAEVESLFFDILLQLLQANSGTAFVKADCCCFFASSSQTLSHLTFYIGCNTLKRLRNRS